MIFTTKQEAIKHAGLPYKRDDTMTIMDYSDDVKEVINEWFKTDDKKHETIIIEEDKEWGVKHLYYYKELKPFLSDEDNKIYIKLSDFMFNYHKQYLNWMIKRMMCDSDNYVFVGYITKEEIESRNAILSEIVHRFF